MAFSVKLNFTQPFHSKTQILFQKKSQSKDFEKEFVAKLTLCSALANFSSIIQNDILEHKGKIIILHHYFK